MKRLGAGAKLSVELRARRHLDSQPQSLELSAELKARKDIESQPHPRYIFLQKNKYSRGAPNSGFLPDIGAVFTPPED